MVLVQIVGACQSSCDGKDEMELQGWKWMKVPGNLALGFFDT